MIDGVAAAQPETCLLKDVIKKKDAAKIIKRWGIHYAGI